MYSVHCTEPCKLTFYTHSIQVGNSMLIGLLVKFRDYEAHVLQSGFKVHKLDVSHHSKTLYVGAAVQLTHYICFTMEAEVQYIP